MAEWFVVAMFVVGAILAIRSVGGRQLVEARPAAQAREELDLPCPWCQAATTETDTRCPGCGRRFG